MKKSVIMIVCAVLCIASIITCTVILKGKRNSVGSGEQGQTPENTPVSNIQIDTEFTDRDKDSNYSINGATTIVFNDKVTVSGKNATAENNNVTITGEGTFIVSGTCEDGKVVVQANQQDKLQIIFDNLNLTSLQGPAVYIKCADKVFITLTGENTLTGGEEYIDGETSLDGVLFSKEDLTLNGSGTLNITGKKHGIVSKDDLVIVGCTLNVKSENVCLFGKDCVKILGGKYYLNAGSDAIRSDNSEDTSKGFIHIEDGDFNIISGNDGLQAENILNIINGMFDIVTGGGSKNASTITGGGFNNNWQFGGGGPMGNEQPFQTSNQESAKAIKASGSITIRNGMFNIDSADDCIHSNSNIVISGGTFNMASGDDGVHADTKLSITGGNIKLTKSYEGLEGAQIEISDGKLDITASDDGLNAAGGNDQSSMQGRPGQNPFNSDASAYINITGGYTFINASGDGIDSNGAFSLSGGTVLVSGPTNSGNGAFDYGSSASVTGGILIATGSSGMATGFTEAQNQGAILVRFSTQQGDKALALTDENNNVICSFIPTKQYSSAVVTAPGIEQNKSYQLVVGGTVTGIDENGFATQTTLIGGSVIATIEMSDLIYGNSMGGGMGMGGMGEPGNMRPGR